MHRKLTRRIEDFTLNKSWQWFKKRCLKLQTASLLTTVQNQAFGTSYLEAEIERSRESAKCRI